MSLILLVFISLQNYYRNVMAMLEISKRVVYEFWYDYVKSKYDEEIKRSYMDANSFIVWVKTDYIYEDLAKYIKTRFNPSNYELDRQLVKEKIRNQLVKWKNLVVK